MEISKELAQDILDHMSCSETQCDNCRLTNTNCANHHTKTAVKLRELLEDVEQNESVSQETEKHQEATYQLEPERATQYISITVAEYHFLTRMATLLEIILADKSYSPNTVVAAVRTVVQEMVQHAEAGADQ